MPTSAILFGPWSGAVTSNSAVVKVAVEPNRAARLAFSRNSDLTAAQMLSPSGSSLSEMKVVAFNPTGLQPNTQYHYALEIDGKLDGEKRGRFRTFPTEDQPASFMFVCAGDADTGSEHEVFDVIRNEQPLFFLHLGDLHYSDVNSALEAKYRKAYKKAISSKTQSALYRDVALAYVWDDHDYVVNNGHRLTPGRKQARLTYQECVPHYPLVAGTGDVPIYQAFTVGRVRFLLTDTRSERDDSDAPGFNKTILGQAQKQWLKDELRAGKDRYKLMVWVNSVPWIGEPEENADEWFGYTTERSELGQFIITEGIRNVCMLSADAHMLAIDDGRNNRPPNGAGGFPVFHASPLDRRRSDKGGPYLHGPVPKSSGQYGVFKVEDSGGTTVKVEWIGKRVGKTDPMMGLEFTSPATK
ncbi:MAG: alkaline phosphatase D family protein [Blastocatellia bacterium]